jgi:ribosomal peptide maturation radical SAM protein 1
MKRVLLVVPPYHSLTSPALSISLLKAALGRLGIPADVLYLNLEFGAFIGRTVYDQVAQNARALAGDWLFAGDLFGDQAPDPGAYASQILATQLNLEPDVAARIEAMRPLVPAFLESVTDALPLDTYRVVVTCADLSVGEDRIQNCAGLAFLRRLKTRDPEIVTVMGGANCQADLGAALHDAFPFVDYVCTGEGERALPRLVERLLAGQTATDMPGLLGHSGSHPLGATIGPPLIRDLDSLPYPDYDDFFTQFSTADLGPGAGPILVFEASRGCWWGEKHHCTFCGLNGAGMQYRSKSPRRALDELDFLVQRHEIRTVFATDMILNPRYFDTFLAALADRPWPPSLFFETKANLTKEQLRILARAGVRELQPGVESFSTPILRLMDKGVTALQNVRVLKWCAELGIQPFWNVLYGFPGEDPAEYERMARLIPSLTHLPAPYRMIQIRMDRFSPNFDESEARGFINVRPAVAYNYVYPHSLRDLGRLAYYFDYDYADGRDPGSYTAALQEAVAEWRNGDTRARLELRLKDDVLEIEDSRPAAVRSTTILRGPERLAYLALDAGSTVRDVTSGLERALGHEAPGSEQVEAWLEEWLALRLVMREGARYLSLATNPAERIPLPAERLLAMLTPTAVEG